MYYSYSDSGRVESARGTLCGYVYLVMYANVRSIMSLLISHVDGRKAFPINHGPTNPDTFLMVKTVCVCACNQVIHQA